MPFAVKPTANSALRVNRALPFRKPIPLALSSLPLPHLDQHGLGHGSSVQLWCVSFAVPSTLHLDQCFQLALVSGSSAILALKTPAPILHSTLNKQPAPVATPARQRPWTFGCGRTGALRTNAVAGFGGGRGNTIALDAGGPSSQNVASSPQRLRRLRCE